MKGTAGERYLAGTALVALGAVVVALVLPAGRRNPALLATALGVAAQGPFGWWVVRSIGTGRLLLVWGLGMAARLALLAIAALVVAPALGWPAAPLLFALLAVVLALVAVEGIVLVLTT